MIGEVTNGSQMEECRCETKDVPNGGMLSRVAKIGDLGFLDLQLRVILGSELYGELQLKVILGSEIYG